MVGTKNAILFALVLVYFLSRGTYADVPSSPDASLTIVTSNVTPLPVEPGRDLLLEVSIKNNGKSEAENVSVEIRPPVAFSLKDEAERVAYSSLCGSCYVTRTYHLHVDPRAVSGTYEVEIVAASDGFAGRIWTSKRIDVAVRGEPQLVIYDVKLRPETISPDDKFSLSISIANKGTGMASGIGVKALLKDLPFIPIGTDSVVIEKLEAGTYARADFDFLAKNNGKPAPYSIPIRLTYRNENGESRASEESVGVKVFGKARPDIANVKTDPVRIGEGEYFVLMVTVENSGQGDAKSVRASIVGLPFGGSKTAFLGKLDSGDDAPAIFNLQAGGAGNYEYNLTIEYEDDLGKHAETRELEMTAFESSGNGAALMAFGAIVVLALVAYAVYRSRQGRKPG